MTKISYIIVTWNNEEIIEECVETLLKYGNGYDNEVIIVDNDSKDNTCEVIKNKFGEKVILLETGKNNGFSTANNIGLKHATGEYIFYVNPDVIFVEDILSPMIKVLEENLEIGIVSPRLIYPDGSYQVSTANYPSVKKLIWDDCQLYHFLSDNKKKIYAQAQYKKCDNRIVDWSYGAAHFCRMDDVKKVGGYPADFFMYGEDMEFCMSFLDVLHKTTYYLGDSKLIHLGGYSEKKVVNSKKVVYVTRAGMSFVERYYGFSELKKYKRLLYGISFVKSVIFSICCCFSSNPKFTNGKIKWKTSYQMIYNDDGKIAENKVGK